MAFGPSTRSSRGLDLSTVMHLIRLMRLLRVLRLVKLFKAVPPLYRLLVGVVESLKAMQWVMVLTMLSLYGCAIVFTSLVTGGSGILFDTERPPRLAEKRFGTMATSLFSLFRLMNADIAVVNPIVSSVGGKLLFVVFMCGANWAILAILTSVVSDNMIQCSQKDIQESEAFLALQQELRMLKTLPLIFGEVGVRPEGSITEKGWRSLMADEGLRHALCKESRLPEASLEELFHISCGLQGKLDDPTPYEEFVRILKEESQVVDKRMLLKVMTRLHGYTNGLKQGLGKVSAGLLQDLGRIEDAKPVIARLVGRWSI